MPRGRERRRRARRPARAHGRRAWRARQHHLHPGRDRRRAAGQDRRRSGPYPDWRDTASGDRWAALWAFARGSRAARWAFARGSRAALWAFARGSSPNLLPVQQPSVCDCVPFVPGSGALFFLYSGFQRRGGPIRRRHPCSCRLLPSGRTRPRPAASGRRAARPCPARRRIACPSTAWTTRAS